MPIDNESLERAADKLDRIGRHYGWWPKTVPEWRNLDPIGKAEFLGLVDEIVTASQST